MRVGVARGDDLALLGQLEPARHRAGRGRQHGPMRGTSAPPKGSAAAVEDRQLHARLQGGGHELLLRPVEEPVRGQVAGFLVRVRVAEHDLLPIPTGAEVGPILRLSQEVGHDHPRAGQRIGGLEERHNVEERTARADPGGPRGRDRGVGGQAGKHEDVAHVRGTLGEADHVASAGRLAVPALRGGHRPERGEDFACRHPRLHLTIESGRRLGQRGEGGAVDRTVLAHLEGGEVEPERLHLPAQVLQRTVGDPAEPVVRERLGQLRQLGDERLRPFVSSPLRTGQAGQVRPRPVEPLGDGSQAAPVGLPREAPLQLAHRFGQVVRVGMRRREIAGGVDRRAAAQRRTRRPRCCRSRTGSGSGRLSKRPPVTASA